MKHFYVDFSCWCVSAETEQGAIDKVHKFFDDNLVRPEINNVEEAGEEADHDMIEAVNLTPRPIDIFIVQSEYGGIPDEPFVTTNEAEADAKYIAWWNDQRWLDTQPEMKTVDEVNEFVSDFEGDDFCRYWQDRIILNP